MNTVWREDSATDRPADDSSTHDADQTQVRPLAGAPPAADSDESPIMRLVRNHERTKPTTKPIAAADGQAARLPVGVLTDDPTFAQHISAALGDDASVVALANIDAAAELAASGGCPILVTDVELTRNAIEALTQRLRSHDPATAIVICGNRDQSARFIGLQSSGAIDAFLLKPVTAAATQLVIEAATRRYRNHDASGVETKRKVRTRPHHRRERTLVVAADFDSGETIEAQRTPSASDDLVVAMSNPSASTVTSQRARPSWTLLAIIMAVAIGAIAWAFTQRSSGLDPDALVTKHMTLAESAFAAGRLIDARDGAAHHYQTVLAIDPQNLAAHRGLDAIAHALSKEAQDHLAKRRLADAVVSLARLRELQPSYAELPLLDSQLTLLQESLAAAHAPRAEAPEPAAPARPAATASREAIRKEPRRATTPSPAIPTSVAASEESPAAAPQVSNDAGDVPVAEDLRASTSPPAADSPRQSAAIAELARATNERAQPTQLTTDRSELTASLARPPARAPVAAPARSSAPPTPKAEPAAAPPQDETPELIKYVPPKYPSDARRRGLEGWIEISMEVTPNGDVLKPRIEDGDKRQLFGREALGAVRQWKYEPDATRVAGKRSHVRLEFKLQE